jgi:GNAT superfamily N-acetyltransferase
LAARRHTPPRGEACDGDPCPSAVPSSSASRPTTLREVQLAVKARRDAAAPLAPLAPGEDEPLVLAMVAAGMDASRVDEAADEVARAFGRGDGSSLAHALRRALLAGATAEEVAECVVAELEAEAAPPMGGWTSKGAAVASASAWSVCSFVTSVDVVHAHWRHDAGEGCLVHRTRSEYTLHFWPTAPCGGVMQLRCARWRRERADRWPPWIGTTLRRVDPRVVPSTAAPAAATPWAQAGPPSSVAGKRPQSCVATDAALAAAATTHCKRTCAVLSEWEWSHARSSDLAPVLLPEGPLSLAHDPDAWSTEDGALRAVRVRSMAEALETGAFAVLKKRFHTEYATHAVERSTADADAILCAAQNAAGVTVAAFAVVAYRCRLCDGTRSVALMVDSFAVHKDHEGTGVGGRVFRELLRDAMSERHCPGAGRRRYVVFAQCLNTKGARLFWKDKLDDSSVARSLLLQAFAMDGGARVEVQSVRECTPRAREYFCGGGEATADGTEETEEDALAAAWVTPSARVGCI